MHELIVSPMFGNALQFAFEKATTEGKITIVLLVIVSLFSWTVMITKGRQLFRASRASRRFYAGYRATRDPMELYHKNEDFTGSPAFDVYQSGGDELAYHLKNNPVHVEPVVSLKQPVLEHLTGGVHTDLLARKRVVKISPASYEAVKVALERAVSAQSLSLEKGMIILSTAVAGGPFIGLLGTVWGVMETFSGIAKVQAASLIAMAPGVAGALIATVVGLFVAIPAMFAYNYMVTTIRAITQEVDNFTTEYATAIEHVYVDNRPVSEEIADALRRMRDETPVEKQEPALF